MNDTHLLADACASDLESIRRLLTHFAWFADSGEGEELSGLFLPDATLSVGGMELAGREQIASDCLRRAAIPGRKTRHVWSNLRVVRADAAMIETTAIQLTFEQIGVDVPAQLRVNDLFDTFARDSDGAWRFSSRRIQRALAFEI